MKRITTPALAFVALAAMLAAAGCGKQATTQSKQNPSKTPTATSASKPGAPSDKSASANSGTATGTGLPGVDIPGLNNGLAVTPGSSAPVAAAVSMPANPSVKDVLSRIASVYHSAKTLQMSGTMHASQSGTGRDQSMDAPIAFTFARPNKMRMASGSGQNGNVIVSDGKTAYIYLSQINQYKKIPAPKGLVAGSGKGEGSLTLELLSGKDINAFMNNPKMLPSQKIGGVDCFVIAYTPNVPPIMPGAIAKEKVWVGKSDLLVRQIESNQTVPISVLAKLAGPKQHIKAPISITQRTTSASVVANATLPANTFKFTPPNGAKPLQVPKMPPPGAKGPGGPQGALPAAEPGQKAPSFNMSSLEGQKVALSDYKGKPVLVMFWATASPQSKKALPGVEKVYQDLKKDGVGVVGISLDSNKQPVEKFVKDNSITFPVLFGYQEAFKSAIEYSGGKIGLPAIFVVDKNGVVKGMISGYKSTSDLKSSLANYGVK